MHYIPEKEKDRDSVATANGRRFPGKIRRLWGVALTPRHRLFMFAGMNGSLAICGSCRNIMS